MKKLYLVLTIMIVLLQGCVLVLGSDHNVIKSDPDTHTKVTQDNDTTQVSRLKQ